MPDGVGRAGRVRIMPVFICLNTNRNLEGFKESSVIILFLKDSAVLCKISWKITRVEVYQTRRFLQ